jgi:predicted 3-demethylubiquinone-9 3-methyltransferase (glyoxalase superfamily)
MAKFMWSFVNEALGWDGYPKSMEDLLCEWLPRKFGVSFQVDLFCFAGLAWAL